MVESCSIFCAFVNVTETSCLYPEPQSVELSINGKTDKCSLGEDINFQFTGFGIVGKVRLRTGISSMYLCCHFYS